MLWAYVLTALTYFLGAGPLRAVRSQMGRGFYWALVMVLSVSSIVFGLFSAAESARFFLWVGGSFLSVATLIGLFCEFEESGWSFDLSAAFSLLVLSFLSLGVAGILFWMHGKLLVAQITALFEQSLKSASLEIPATQLLSQTPSVIIILWMLALYCSVLMEGRIRIAGAPRPHVTRAEMFQFRAPEWVVWVFIASLLPAFGSMGPAWLQLAATNTLNVCIAIFFFQGIGIIHQYLISMRVSLFWQTLLVLFLIVQLFIFVSCLGLADHWLDVRTKLIKWRQSRLETYKRREK